MARGRCTFSFRKPCITDIYRFTALHFRSFLAHPRLTGINRKPRCTSVSQISFASLKKLLLPLTLLGFAQIEISPRGLLTFPSVFHTAFFVPSPCPFGCEQFSAF